MSIEIPFLTSPTERSMSADQYLAQSPTRILYHFLTEMATTLMQDFMKLIFTILLLLVASIVAAFYPDQWLWKLITFGGSFALSVTILLTLHHRWLRKMSEKAFKSAFRAEGRQFMESLPHLNGWESLSDEAVEAAFSLHSIQKSLSNMPSENLQKLGETPTLSALLHSSKVAEFTEIESQKIKDALRYVLAERTQTEAQ